MIIIPIESKELRMKINFKFDKRFLFIFLSLFVIFFLMNSIRWTYHVFHRVNFDEIGIVLNSGVGAGADNELLWSFFYKAFLRSIFHTLIFATICQIFRKKFVLVITYIIVFALLVQKLIISNVQFGSFFNFKKSNFYETEFVDPEKTNISWPQKRNVVFIALESFEKVYSTTELYNQVLTPNITRLEKQNVSFENYNQISGFTHTIAAITGFTTGLPLFFTGYKNFDKMVGAYGIGKIFKNAGYQTWSIFPATGRFSKKAAFMQRMGFDTIIDGDYIRQDLTNPPAEKPFDGVDDGTLFEYSKPIIKNIIKSKQPYFIFMETINTHIDGYFTEYCKKMGFKQETIYDIIQCDDKIIYDFVRWMQKQDPSAVIILVDDHEYMARHFFKQLEQKESRPLSNVFINTNAFSKTDKNKPISSMDFFPTVIEAAGAKIEGCKLGLGTSLTSRCRNEKTMRERFGDKKLEKKLEQKNDLYYKLSTGN